MEELKQRLEELQQRIAELEDLLSCKLCGTVASLHVCEGCGKKCCRYCYTTTFTKNYRGDPIVRFLCKWCS
jgi:hypothetical protein